MDIVRIGLDLAKTVFQVHGVGRNGKTLMMKTLRREGGLLGHQEHPSSSR